MPVTFSFDEFIKKLTSTLQGDLPGALAHEVMRAVPIGSFKLKFEYPTPPKPGSVLILLYQKEGKIFFPLTKRPDYQGAHGGQISLPGGKMEPGEDSITTALRECEEEIGISASDIHIIGKLSEFFVIPSNYLVTPVVGFIKVDPVFKPDPVEVEKIILGNVNDLISDDAIKSKEILAAGRFPLTAPYFDFEEQTVWGATAMMLNELREVIRKFDTDFERGKTHHQ